MSGELSQYVAEQHSWRNRRASGEASARLEQIGAEISPSLDDQEKTDPPLREGRRES